MHRVGARTMYAPGQNRNSYNAPGTHSTRTGRRAHAKRSKKSRAEQLSAWDNLYTEQPEIRLADSAPQKEVPAIREKPKAPEICNQVQSEAAQEKPSAVRHVKQPVTWTPRSAAAPVMRGHRADDS